MARHTFCYGMSLTMNDPKHTTRGLALLLILVCGAALVVRFYAIGWSLPYVEHGDESAIMAAVVLMLRNDDLHPHTFVYPSLCYYLFAAVGKVHLWWGIRNGIYASAQDLPLQSYLYTTAPGLYLWGRTVVALLSATTVPLLYLLGRRMFDARIGLLAAALLALAAFHVEHSHYLTTDAATGLWVVLSLLGAWRVVTTGDWSGYVLGGTGVGLAAGTKYNAGVVALGLVVAHLLHWRLAGLHRSFVRLVAAGIISLCAFLVTTPYALLDWAQFRSDLHYDAIHYGGGWHGDFMGRWPFGEYARFILRDSLRVTGGAMMLLGLPLLVRRFGHQVALLLAVIGAQVVLVASQSVHFVRNLLPVFPLLVLLAAAGAVALTDRLSRRNTGRIALAVLAAGLLLPQARETGWKLRYWSRPHTAALVTQQLQALPQGLRFAVEMNQSMFPNNPVVFAVEQVIEHPLDWYRRQGYRYLVTNSDHHTEAERGAYEQLKAGGVIIAEYPERRTGVQPGPGGMILDLGVQPEMLQVVRREAEFGGEIELVGYEMQPGLLRSQITPLDGSDARRLQPGDGLQLNLYWRTLAPMAKDYVLFVHVVDNQGQKVAQRDAALRGDDYPTSHWQPGEVVVDRADVQLPALPAGDYRLEIGLYDAADGQRLPVSGLAEAANGSVALTTITVQ